MKLIFTTVKIRKTLFTNYYHIVRMYKYIDWCDMANWSFQAYGMQTDADGLVMFCGDTKCIVKMCGHTQNEQKKLTAVAGWRWRSIWAGWWRSIWAGWRSIAVVMSWRWWGNVTIWLWWWWCWCMAIAAWLAISTGLLAISASVNAHNGEQQSQSNDELLKNNWH